MPVIIDGKKPHPFLPTRESPSAIDALRAERQDVRPLHIAVLNLMADKLGTEKELAGPLGHTPIQVHLTFVATDSYIHDLDNGYVSKHTAPDHIRSFYTPWSRIRDEKFDGLIITGINARQLDITTEAIWPQVQAILDWSRTNVVSCLFLCWGAQAALKHLHNIDRHRSEKKNHGVFPHRIASDKTNLLYGFPDRFPIPVSRWNEIRAEDIHARAKSLEVAALSDEAGVGVIVDPRHHADSVSLYPRDVYVLAHPEYATATLGNEYRRDSANNPATPTPRHYFPDDKPDQPPLNTWRHTAMIYTNWVNLLYKVAPYDRASIAG